MAIVVYVIGIPLLLLILLCVNQRRGTLEYPAIEFDGNGVIEPVQVNAAVQRLNEYFRNRVAFGSLYDQYEASFYWFEFGCTMRKMILTGALVLFGAGTTPQVVAALAVCILWFGLIANLKPFGDNVDDRLAQFEAIQILFTLLIGLVLQLQATSEEGTKEEEDALGVVLIVLNLAVIALAFIQQPIVLTIAARVLAVAVRIKERAASRGKREDLDAAAADDVGNQESGIVADAGAGRDDTGAQPMRDAKGVPSHSNPMRRVELAMASATACTSGNAMRKTTAIEMTSMPMRANPFHRDSVSAGGLKGVPRDVTEHAGESGASNPMRPAAERAHDGQDAEAPSLQFEGVNHMPQHQIDAGSAFKATVAERSVPIETDDADGDPTLDEIQAHSEGWFYADNNDASGLHGPFPLAEVRGWLDDGECQCSDLVRHGRDGKDVALSTLARAAEDGRHYTRAEFVEHFGGTGEWDAARTL